MQKLILTKGSQELQDMCVRFRVYKQVVYNTSFEMRETIINIFYFNLENIHIWKFFMDLWLLTIQIYSLLFVCLHPSTD